MSYEVFSETASVSRITSGQSIGKTGEGHQQGREAVQGKALRGGLRVGLALGPLGNLHRFGRRVTPGLCKELAVILRPYRDNCLIVE